MARSLCFPDNQKSCFACCPPIRPPEYEHIQYRKSLQRLLRENTYEFDSRETEVKPITGFSCWGLGYPDKDFRLIGCLLHPAGNQGRDLRYRIDYGEKCRRETCQESGVFAELSDREQTFWLNLSTGMDSFTYSSRTENPLFHLLNWGSPVLKLIAAREPEIKYDRTSFFRAYPFFTAGVNPKAGAYLLNSLINGETFAFLKEIGFKKRFTVFYRELKKDLTRELPEKEEGNYIHRLEPDKPFLDFLRLSLKRTKMEAGLVEGLKEMTDSALRQFRREI